MAGLRGLVAGLILGSAVVVAVPARAQLGSSVSLTHTVSVMVPPRVKVQVASLAVPAAVSMRAPSTRMNVDGLSLTINASQGWVLAVGSRSGSSAQKSHLQWSTDGNSEFSTLISSGTAVASGVNAYEAKGATVFFRKGASAGGSTLAGEASAEPVVLTISAP
jgi:hypothetical protein